jgi:hypothetical protein
MSRLAILASIVALAAGSANCADDPAQANSLSGFAPSAVASSSDATLSTLAKGGKPALSTLDGTIERVLLDSTDGEAHFAQHVTFDITTTATVYPYVTLRCFQNGAVVSGETVAMWLDGGVITRTFALGPSIAWTGGEADCTATLEDRDDYYFSRNGKIIDLASTTFHVLP